MEYAQMNKAPSSPEEMPTSNEERMRNMRATMFDQQKTKKPSRVARKDSLYEPRGGGRERGNYPGMVRTRSLYTMTSMHPVATMLSAVAVGAGVILATRRNWR